ncbi:MAG: GspH/FimT family protein [Gemmatimonadota bacterium]
MIRRRTLRRRPARHRTTRRGRGAFSLIEALTVLVLLGILLAAAAPPLARAQRRFAAGGAARELRGDLARARVRAILSGQTVRVVLDTLGAGWRVEGGPLPVGGTGVLRRSLPAGLTLRTTASNQVILFTARGTSSLYSTAWIYPTTDPDARWHRVQVAPTGAVSP